MDSIIGKTIGQYQIQSMAGKGGMAVVYKAFQPSLNRYVALKVLPDYMAQDEQFVARFKQEALAAAGLRHQNIMVIYDVGREGNTHYIAAEYLEGTTLSQVIAGQRGPLPLPRVVNIMSQLASALDFAHQRGLVHRDIKPSNIFISSDDHVTLMDFGIVKALMSESQMTRTGVAVGTPEYMSPEQGEGRQIDRRSDIYSMGVVLYQLLTGRVPFEAETPTAILLAHITKPPKPPTALNPAIPRPVEAVVMRSLAKRPEDRFATAGELARALAQAAAGAPMPSYIPQQGGVPARPPATPPSPPYTVQPTRGPGTPPPPPAARRGGPNWLLIGGGIILLLAVLCIGSLVALGGLGAVLSGSSTATPQITLGKTPTSRPGSTPTPKPGPGPTTAPSGQGVLMVDDFSSQSKSESNGWAFDPLDNVDYSWDPNFTMHLTKKQWLGLNWPDGNYDDFGAEIEAHASSQDYAEYGIIIRLKSESDVLSYYIFGISTDGKYYLSKKLNGKWTSPDPIKSTASGAIKQGTNSNKLRVLAQGSQLSLYVNGTLLKTITDSDLTDGHVGIFAGTGDNDNAQVTFTSYRLLTVEKAKADWGIK